MNRHDWDRGLPFDVMAIMMEAAPGSTRTTRLVSKTWQTSAEGVVTKLKIPFNAPVPQNFFKLGDRFPELTSLDVGASLLPVHQLHQLQGIKKLTHLTLGARKSPGPNFPHVIESKPPDFPPKCLALQLRHHQLEWLQRSKTIKVLDLRGCTSLDDEGIGRLRGMQLNELVLVRSKELTNRALKCLSQMPLTKLTLEQITKVTHEGLLYLRHLPLVRLSLRGCLGLTDDAIPILSEFCTLEHLSLAGCHKLTISGVAPLFGAPSGVAVYYGGPVPADPNPEAPLKLPRLNSLDLGLLNTLEDVSMEAMLRGDKQKPPLTQLSLEGCKKMSDAALIPLKKLTDLVDLSLARWVKLTDAGMAHLKGNDKLTSLNIENCHRVTNVGFESLVDKPLKVLDMRRCNKVTAVGIGYLSGLPLERLYMRRCVEICDAALQHLHGAALRELDLRRCNKITDAGLEALVGMPLRYLDLGHCENITDAGMVHLRGMPLEYLVLVSLTAALTPVGLKHVRDAPLVYLDVRHCPGLPPVSVGLADFKKYVENGGRKLKVLT